MPYRIMVVDDSAFMRKIVSDLIEQDPDFQVIGTARNGREAIEQIAELSPDLVTMDVEMPEMNGLDALKIIMKRQPLPVIMLSGINEQGMRETIMALELGAFDFIRKPSASTSTHDVGQVKRELHEQIRTAMLMRERKAAREQLALKAPVEQEVRRPAVKNKPARSVVGELKRAADTLLPERNTPGKGTEQVLPEQAARSQASKLERGQQDSLNRAIPKQETEIEKARRAAKTESPSGGDGAKHRNSAAPQNQGAVRLPGLKKDAPSSATGLKEDSSSKLPAQQQRGNLEGGKPGARTDFTDIVAIGTSTGGPKALKTVLEKIPRNFPAPIVIVQHMPPNFTKSLAQRLDSLSQLRVVEAEEGMKLQPGTAYIAPGGFHMNIVSSSEGYKVSLSSQEPRNGHRPSVEVLYESLLPLAVLKKHVVLLTGMGSDGARAMKKLYEAGVTSTIAESEETCVVYGMPRSAIELHCVSHVLPLQEIGPKLVQVVK
ncbi:protein-glutamate methylesterase/protein-glutamine glutaminase [Paenibacillus ihumii]|uniref:protein-glutamate methylesterase/protein-glutamine glutaminase n=1 Tax=Paenibacillus ihumii TaxID=687436 RepID=UPI0006D7C776|nr:chemotaxis response regulator protein-glutamate methylesterase [Paenibacillus ihumii]